MSQRYRGRNGEVPESELTIFHRGRNSVDGDWFWGLPPASYAKHLNLLTLARRRGRGELSPSDGWGTYRPKVPAQVIARRIYGNGAAVPGTSSHGLYWEGQDTAAVDYSNWGEIYGWDILAFAADCRAVGLTPLMIVPARGYPYEPWHVIDLNPLGPVPALLGLGAINFDPQGDDMYDDKAREELMHRLDVVMTPAIARIEQMVQQARGGAYSFINIEGSDDIVVVSLINGNMHRIGNPYHASLLDRVKRGYFDTADMLTAELDIVRGYLTAINPPPTAIVDSDALIAELSRILPAEAQGEHRVEVDPASVKAAVDAAIDAHTSTIAFVQKPAS
ncbi:hypothetical protein [Microbacterium testaceum]|uniref:hypothetical protein n=1 Tax=Microbacterium testaceum TaxID=2033 RepID=UPI0024353C0C|nr:hypothetical protein [Microbacterium testaceum]